MSEVAKVVFLADKLDPHKVERFPYLKRGRGLNREHSLDIAILEYLNHTIEYFHAQWQPHPSRFD